MTPEEKAVIDIALSGEWDGVLDRAVDALINSRGPREPAAAELCNAQSPGGAMRCVLPNSHTADRPIELHEGRTRHGHVRRWKEVQ